MAHLFQIYNPMSERILLVTAKQQNLTSLTLKFKIKVKYNLVIFAENKTAKKTNAPQRRASSFG